MSETDRIFEGTVCMSCLMNLISDDGDINDTGAPCYCRDCWNSLPAKDKGVDGAPYFDEKTGQVVTGPQPKKKRRRRR